MSKKRTSVHLSEDSAADLPATEDVGDAADELDAESDLEEVRKRLQRYEEELRLLRCPQASGQFTSELPVARYQLKDLLPQIIPALKSYDTTFLTDYVTVLQTMDAARIERVTSNVMASIEDALRQQASADRDVLGEQRAVLGAFLCAACLAERPRASGARPALRQLLAYTDERERVELARAWWRALPAAALLLLSDAVRAPRAAGPADAPSLAELTLRAALCKLPPDDDGTEPQWELGAPVLEELEGALAVWERQQRFAEAEDAERVMLFGRVLGVAPPSLRPALLRRLAAARPALLHDKLAAARADRKVGVCKLQILFGAEATSKSPRTRNIKTPNESKITTPIKNKRGRKRH